MKIKAYCIIRRISDRVKGQRKGVCISVSEIFQFAIVLLLNNQLELSTNPCFFSALLAIPKKDIPQVCFNLSSSG